ncbi:MAG: hypothetical protein GC134_01855 [Proteobacteria bacterium]|nr:hypothetical protein [Pseudomonadota bacterium]
MTALISKAGSAMNPHTLSCLIEILTTPDNDGMTQAQVAEMAGISERTVRNYLTPEVWEEIRKIRLAVMARSLALVDRALFAKAAGGDVSAAKLIYSRWDEHKEVARKLTPWSEELTAIDAELKQLQEEIDALEAGSRIKTETTESAQA